MNSTVVGLDIGTTKVAAVVGEMVDESRCKVIGVGITPSKGMEKGVVVNVEETTNCIQVAIDQAQRMADMAIDYVYVGFAGSHIESLNHEAEVELADQDLGVTPMDLESVLQAAKTIALPAGKEFIHSIVREYILDGARGLKDPLGMSGTRLGASVHVVTGAANAIRDLVKCAHNVNLDVAEVILQPLASAEAVLTEDEKKLGVILVDIGGGTTDIAVFHQGKLAHSGGLSIGGGHFTNDLAVYLRSSFNEVERQKIRYGSVDKTQIDGDLTIEVNTVGGDKSRRVSLDAIVDVLQARGRELVELVLSDVYQQVGDLSQLSAGIVLTGGGSQLRGLESLFREISGMPVQMGKTRNITGLVDKVSSPIFSTAVGLIYHGYRNHELVMQGYHDESLMERAFSTVKGWFL
jgi:cell division protein FtsA